MKNANTQDLIQLAKDKLAQGHLTEVFAIMKESCQRLEKSSNLKTELESGIIILEGKKNMILEYERIGNITTEEIIIRKTQLSKSILDYLQLLENGNSEPNHFRLIEETPGTRNTIQLTLDQSFETYSPKDRGNLLLAIGVLLDLPKTDVVIKKIIKGSVIVYVELGGSNKSKELETLINDGALHFLNVSKAKVLPFSTKEILPKIKKEKHRVFISFHYSDMKYAQRLMDVFKSKGSLVHLSTKKNKNGPYTTDFHSRDLEISNEIIILLSKRYSLSPSMFYDLGFLHGIDKKVTIVLIDIKKDNLPGRLSGSDFIEIHDSRKFINMVTQRKN